MGCTRAEGCIWKMDGVAAVDYTAAPNTADRSSSSSSNSTSRSRAVRQYSLGSLIGQVLFRAVVSVCSLARSTWAFSSVAGQQESVRIKNKELLDMSNSTAAGRSVGVGVGCSINSRVPLLFLGDDRFRTAYVLQYSAAVYSVRQPCLRVTSCLKRVTGVR